MNICSFEQHSRLKLICRHLPIGIGNHFSHKEPLYKKVATSDK